MTLLSLRGRDAAVRRPCRRRRRRSRCRGRRRHRHDRPERRGQDHAVQPDLGLPDAERGAHRVRRRGHHRRCPEQIAASGLVRTFQLVQLFQNLTVLENVQVGCHLHTRGGVLSALMRTPRHASDRARGRGARPRTARLRRAGGRRRHRRRARSPMASSGCSKSRARLPRSPSCCCSTNRRPGFLRMNRNACRLRSAPSPGAARPCC